MRTWKCVSLLFALTALSGCGAVQRLYTRWTGDLTYKCSRQGVEYVQSDSGLALSVDASGKTITCKGE